MLDPKRINWKVVAAIIAAIGYVAFKNGGLKKMPKAFAAHGAVAAVLAIVAYFGLDVVMKHVKSAGYVPEQNHDLPPADWPEETPYPPLNGARSQVQGYVPQHRSGIAAVDPGGNPYSPSLGC